MWAPQDLQSIFDHFSTLRKKCPFSVLFLSVFSRIRIRITPNPELFLHERVNLLKKNSRIPGTTQNRKVRLLFRSSQRMVLYKKSVLKNFGTFTGKHLFQSLFFNKVLGLRSATLSKKRLWHRSFPVNFQKFLRAPFLQNPRLLPPPSPVWLLLAVAIQYFYWSNVASTEAATRGAL